MNDDSCLFCSIVSGATKAVIVHEDADSLVFLDHRPLFPGHCLVVPRKHSETLSDLPEKSIEPFFKLVQLMARGVEAAMEAEGTFVAMNNRVSQSVPHLHVHVVPRKRKDGLKGFFWPRTKYASQDEMIDVGKRITEQLSQFE
jgi:Diadenosine tetraphosphate (Ap4A) hydrolase and other HIT family hydrolases